MSETERNIKIPNGGRSITLGDTKFDVLSGYSPSWAKEYGDSITTWNGRIVKRCKGVRFSLEFSTYGLSASEIKSLKSILSKKEIALVCDEFSGNVSCDDFSADLKSANFYGEFFNTTIKLTAVALIAASDEESGSL